MEGKPLISVNDIQRLESQPGKPEASPRSAPRLPLPQLSLGQVSLAQIVGWVIAGIVAILFVLTLLAFRGKRVGLSTILPFLDRSPVKTIDLPK